MQKYTFITQFEFSFYSYLVYVFNIDLYGHETLKNLNMKRSEEKIFSYEDENSGLKQVLISAQLEKLLSCNEQNYTHNYCRNMKHYCRNMKHYCRTLSITSINPSVLSGKLGRHSIP